MRFKRNLKKGFIIGAIIGLILFFVFFDCVTPQERRIHGCSGHGAGGYFCKSWFAFFAKIFIILTTDKTCFCGGECMPSGLFPYIFGLPLTVLFWVAIGTLLYWIYDKFKKKD